jgi:osmotically-inducible protein OsmY
MAFVTILDPDTKACQHMCCCRAVSSTERINRRLKHSNYTGLRAVNCDQIRGCFVLGGSVPNFYLKQVAQELAGKVVGLEKIENHIRVTTGATNR